MINALGFARVEKITRKKANYFLEILNYLFSPWPFQVYSVGPYFYPLGKKYEGQSLKNDDSISGLNSARYSELLRT